jgi:hypothetical protein
MTEHATLQTIARQMERALNRTDGIEGQLMVCTGMADKSKPINGLVAEMGDWRLSQPDADEPTLNPAKAPAFSLRTPTRLRRANRG